MLLSVHKGTVAEPPICIKQRNGSYRGLLSSEILQKQIGP